MYIFQGGLVIRYAVADLLSRNEANPASLFQLPKLQPSLIRRVVPLTYMSVATPHVGARGPGSLIEQIDYIPGLKSFLSTYKGKQAEAEYLRSGLEMMARDCRDSPVINKLGALNSYFIRALSRYVVKMGGKRK
jgi:hypothetical protein